MSPKVTVLTGGVGGAKLVEGLGAILAPADLTAVVNTGDDFRHFGLAISPDIDTLLYTLSGKANRTLGWGREGETWSFMAALRSLGGEDWFNLGDGDLALHVLRSARLAGGEPLSRIVGDFARQWGLGLTILPMSEDPVETRVDTDQGLLAFQRYFVEHQCRPAVRAVDFVGAETARPAPGVIEAIACADVVLIAPSNPWLSIDPILAVAAIRQALIDTRAPVVVVSPLVAGKAVKGPTAKLMAELGLAVNNHTIAAHYQGWMAGMVVHGEDAAPGDVPVARTDTLMHDRGDRERVARVALALALDLR
ncbi:2-phospho-L-lactate transferase [Novosphingobium sp. Fuku2-ISO-50]|uniref:2-phospho-L-lactate transferase n=1 Tax=Novosphingobium sp. Fuku2-ISO-50 TaxID=1739114 RepID=UPI00076CCC71|nr:2-phospho-L-lactate transferase [Novosphingobium sp. Fuku2-ISO-50]KUR76679.1 2-phospho-L-lactate transferase [Novosphingobium sp. Fuku2-ISO-50]